MHRPRTYAYLHARAHTHAHAHMHMRMHMRTWALYALHQTQPGSSRASAAPPHLEGSKEDPLAGGGGSLSALLIDRGPWRTHIDPPL